MRFRKNTVISRTPNDQMYTEKSVFPNSRSDINSKGTRTEHFATIDHKTFLQMNWMYMAWISFNALSARRFEHSGRTRILFAILETNHIYMWPLLQSRSRRNNECGDLITHIESERKLLLAREKRNTREIDWYTNYILTLVNYTARNEALKPLSLI